VATQIQGDNIEVDTFAFLDEGSSVTLIDESFFKRLNISGPPEPICMQWTNQTTKIEGNSVRCNIRVAGAGATKSYWLNNVHTVKNLGLPKQTVNVEYPYNLIRMTNQ